MQAGTDEAGVDARPMIGDANLFLKGAPGEDEFEAEVEIMIAGASPSCLSPPRSHRTS